MAVLMAADVSYRVLPAMRFTSALAAGSAAQWAVLRELGVSGDLFAGHSFGELMALHAAGAFDLPTALRLARRRGELMRDAADVPGAMLALSQTVERVRELADPLRRAPRRGDAGGRASGRPRRFSRGSSSSVGGGR